MKPAQFQKNSVVLIDAVLLSSTQYDFACLRCP